MKKILILMAVLLAMGVSAFAQITPPYAEAFDTVIAPVMPTGWTVIDSNTDAKLWKTSSSYSNSAPNCLYMTYNSSVDRDDWAITPALNLTAGINYTLEFKYKSGGYDEQLAVSLGTAATVAAMGAPLTDLAFDSSTYATASVPITVATTGTYYLGFHGHSSADQFYMCVDDITLSAAGPPNPALIGLPANGAIGVAYPPMPILSWTSGGGGPASYDVYFGTSSTEPAFQGNQDALTFTPTGNLDYSTTYYWKVVPRNAMGFAPGCPIWSFSTWADPTQYTLPWTEGFETGNTNAVAVSGWTQEGIDGTNVWTANDTEIDRNRLPRTGAWNAYLRYGNTRWMFKPVHFEAGVAYQAIVYARQDGTTAANASIGISYGMEPTAAGMTQTILAPTGIIDGDYQAMEGFFTPATTGTYYVGILGTINFSPWYISIDDITIQEAPAGIPNPVTLISPINGARNIPLEGFTLSWAPDLTGGAPTSYDIYLDTNADPGTFFATEPGLTHQVVTPLTPGTVYYWKVIAHNGDGYSDASAVFSFETVPEGLVVIGDGVANLDMPIKPYFNYSYSQSIFLQSEIAMADKRIESVYYYWNGVAEATASNDWTIYMGHTALTEFASTTSWISLDDLSQVFQGNVALPAVAGWIEIPLSTPFIYNNTGNLVIAVDENSASCDGSSEFFLCTGAATNRGIRHYSDSVNADPAAPPVGTLRLGYPNVMLQLGDLPTGPPAAPIVSYPANGATGLPVEGFELSWAMNNAGNTPDSYTVFMASSEETIYDENVFVDILDTSFDPVVDGGLTFSYSQQWYWAVEAVNVHGSAESTIHRFTIIAPPAQISVTPTTLTETLEFGSTSVKTLTINNAGGLPLDYAIGFAETAGRSSTVTPPDQMVQTATDPRASELAERAPFIGPTTENESRAIYDLQFSYVATPGEYAVASDGEYIYTSYWATAGQFGKYNLNGSFIETFMIAGAGGIRDLTYDGTYFYGAASSTTIYQMDFNTLALIGTITSPVTARGIAYDSDQDAFWVGNGWAADLRLVDRSGTQLRALTPAVSSMSGIAYDNVSGSAPTLWANTQNGASVNDIYQINLVDGAVLQTFDPSVHFPDASASSSGGMEIVEGLVPGTASLLCMIQGANIYGLELCDVATWAKAVPRSGTVAPGGSAIVDIEFDATETAPGIHTGLLTVSHNAPTAAVEVPVTLTVTGTWPAVFAMAPVSHDFGDVEQLNPLTKQFTITNTGGSDPAPLIIAAGGISLTNNAEANFTVNATGLPVSLNHNETYTFDVIFTPQTIGDKTATLNVADNLGGAVHTAALTGAGIAEALPSTLLLNGSIVSGTNAKLNWATWNGPVDAPGWIHWGDGIYGENAIGTGSAATFQVAQKFPTAITGMFDGDQLTSVKFVPAAEGATYTIKIWTGTDDAIAPALQVYEQPVLTYTINEWNDVPLTLPYTIDGSEALYIGYYTDTPAGHPAGVDGGPQAAGLGNVVEWGGTWQTLTDLGATLTFNWAIQGYVNSRGGEPIALSSKQASIPVQNKPLDHNAMRNVSFTAANTGNHAGQRALQGYKVYRNSALLTLTPIMAASYLDVEPGLGDFTYQVEAVYGTATLTSNPVDLTFDVVLPYNLPFVEEWNSNNFTAQEWDASAANWVISTTGDPAPSASFSWNPQATNYEEYLTSFRLNGVGQTNVTLSFELSLNNFSTSAENLMAVEVWDGTIWNTVNTWSSLDNEGASFGFTYYSYDISAHAAGHEFKIRFKAYGEDTYEINNWYVDNINVYALPATLAAPVCTVTEDAPDVLIQWIAVPGATWYGLYSADDPYGTYTYLGWLPSTNIGVYMPASDMEFFKVTAGAGALPRGRMLDRGIQQ
ncbi:MAG: choice-of-anchor D domain-containing protein [Candidatus Cloacimonetes bacterium]|nr:choice-of-anchor D domain-containing protein [Candidatus Cloacimonadota bacterium]